MATGLAAVAATLIVAHAHEPHGEDPGTTTVVAAAVCYLLGVLAGLGKPGLAGSLAIGVTALLYFKPEIEGFSAGLKRHEQVSVLQFLVLTFIVLPILPDRGYGPYEALNPRNIWLMVVLVSGLGLATYVALRVAGQRHAPRPPSSMRGAAATPRRWSGSRWRWCRSPTWCRSPGSP